MTADFYKATNVYQEVEGLTYLSPPIPFEDAYLKIRAAEKRIYSLEEIRRLPTIDAANVHYEEWQKRKYSTERFQAYIKQKNDSRILDLGCGNAWFSARIAEANPSCQVLGVDINELELKQGIAAFQLSNLQVVYADIFTAPLKKTSFDIITINSAIQYFSDLKKLLERFFDLLKDGGEVHIIDTPIYEAKEVSNARKRSQAYFQKMACEEMGENYFHRSWEELKGFNYQVLYQQAKQNIWTKIQSKLGKKDSPFPWVCITK